MGCPCGRLIGGGTDGGEDCFEDGRVDGSVACSTGLIGVAPSDAVRVAIKHRLCITGFEGRLSGLDWGGVGRSSVTAPSLDALKGRGVLVRFRTVGFRRLHADALRPAPRLNAGLVEARAVVALRTVPPTSVSPGSVFAIKGSARTGLHRVLTEMATAVFGGARVLTRISRPADQSVRIRAGEGAALRRLVFTARRRSGAGRTVVRRG